MNRISLRTRKKNQARRALYLSAIELFREQGYQETSVEMIAARANQSRSTFFNYYGQKEEILFKVTDNAVRFVTREVEKAEQTCESFPEALFMILRSIGAELKSDKQLYAGVFQELMLIEVSPDPAKRKRGVSRISIPLSRLIGRARKNGELSFKENSVVIAELFFGTLFSACLSYVYAERVNIEKRLESVGRLFLEGAGVS